jgi:hypothetical protein
MFREKLIYAIVVVLFTATSCATTTSAPTIDELIAQGGEVISFTDLIGDAGVTFVSTEGDWFNYLGADGRKVVKINKTGQLKELTWRVNDSGQFCQQMFSTEKEACDNNVIIKDKEGIYNSYNKANSKPGSPFIIMSGNPEGF